MTLASRTLFRLATTLVALLAIVAAGVVDTAHAQQVDDSLPPLADLTIASEYHDTFPLAWVVTVKNETVGAHPGMHISLVKVRITISDPVRGDTTSLWTIRDLPPGGSVEGPTHPQQLLPWIAALRNVPGATSGPEWVPQRFYAEIIESTPVELPRFRFNNATEHWVVENRYRGHFRNGRIYATNGDVGIDVPGISDRLPRPGGATTFTVAAISRDVNVSDRRYLTLVARQDHRLFDVQVEISLSPGLSFAANQPEAPSGTTFDASTGIWNIGTILPSVKLLLPVAVNLTADSLADLPLEERCLTANVVRVTPWFANDPLKRQNDTATACLGKELLTQGETALFDYVDCVGATSTPCTSADTVELVVERETGFYDQPETVIVQIQEPQGRHDGKWRTGKTTHHNASVPDTPGVEAAFSFLSRDYSAYTFALSDVSPKQRPGAFSILGGNAGTFVLMDADTKTSLGPLNLPANTTNNPYPSLLEFSALGTYKVQLTVGATKSGTAHNDTETYTFHVGPAAELAVRDGGHSPLVLSNQRAYTIEAVNNGPDAAPVKVTLTGVPQDAEAIFTDGTYQVREGSCNGGFCDADWNIEPLPVTYPGLPTRTLTLGTSVRDWNIHASIAQARDYTVCIDGDGNDVDASSQTACEATSGNSWHSIDYFDYVDDNNEAFIQSRTGTGERESHGLRAQFYPDPPIAIVLWDELESVHGLVVSHYEVWSAPAPCQTPGEDDAVVERSITIHLDYSIDPDTPTCYAVRAVNNDGTPGFWSEPVMATDEIPGQPRLWVQGGDPVNEGDAAQFTVSASPAPAADDSLTFHYTVIQRGGYVAAGELGRKEATIGNSGRATITVPTVGNDTDDADGEIFVTLNNGEGYTASSDRSASVEVRDNDNPEVSFADDPATATVSEGDGTYDVVVNLVPAPHAATTIRYQIGGVAEAGEDFTIGGLSNGFGSVWVGPGSSSVNILVRLINDRESEQEDFLDIYLRAGEGYVVGAPSRYTLTITDNDGPGAQFAKADSEVGESDGSVGVTVNLVPAPTEDVTINYTLGGGTATRGTDYSIEGLTGSSGSVTVSAGINSVDIPVTINPDSDSEPDETVVLTLGGGSDYTVGTTRTHTLTILDDDRPRAEFASAESTVVEADTTHPVTVNLRPAAPAGGLTLSYGVRSTATRNRDYRASGTVQVSEDAESFDIPVEIIHNGESEPDETVELTLRVGSGNNVGEESVHTLTITDNNLPMVAFETAEASVSETGRTHRAVITLDPAPHEAITIGYTVGGTSTEGVHGQHGPGDDFTISNSGTVTVPRGRNQVFVPITIVNDSDAEGDETIVLTLDTGDGYALDTSANIYELTILDDDAPEVFFTTASGEPGEGAGPHVVRVRLDGQTDNPVTVGVSVSFPPNIGSDNTDDHSAIPGSVTITAGTLETEITVTITDDPDNEADEVVVLTLEPGTGYSLSQDKPTEYTLTIVDNDADENTPVASRDHPHIHGQDSTHFEVYEGHTRIPTWYVTGDFAGDVIFQYVGGTATLDEDFRLFNIHGQIEKVGDTFTVRSLLSPHDSDREAGFRWARFTFDPIRDQEREGGETVILRVLNGPGYTVEEPTELTITIID